MQENYWNNRWITGQTAWHMSETNPRLKEHFHLLELIKGDSVFVPLCGQSLDLNFFLEKDLCVTGLDISPVAAYKSFESQSVGFKSYPLESGQVVQAMRSKLTYIIGDFFKTIPRLSLNFMAIWDRASLVAISPDTRKKYGEINSQILSDNGKILLDTISYESSELLGPPFSVNIEDVKNIYPGFKVEQILCSNFPTTKPRFLESGINELTQNLFVLSRA